MVGDFRLQDYDSVAFEFDNTMFTMKLSPLFSLQYKFLSNYLIERKGYARSVFPSELTDEDADFIQRGLILDSKRGNVLYVRHDGFIIKACHGRNAVLSQSEIEQMYGKDRKWTALDSLISDKSLFYNNSEINTFFHLTDSIGALMFAKAVDAVDLTQNNINSYNVMSDVMEALREMNTPGSIYTRTLLADLPKYGNRMSEEVEKWLIEMKKDYKFILITNSPPQIADHTIPFCFFNNHLDLFDLVICNARKPDFFNRSLPFQTLQGKEVDIKLKKMYETSEVYQQGSWPGLLETLRKSIGRRAKCIYVGGNPLEDNYVPAKSPMKIDTIAVLEEIFGETIHNDYPDYPYSHIVASKFWGPLLKSTSGECTLLGDMVRQSAKVTIPSVKYLARRFCI